MNSTLLAASLLITLALKTLTVVGYSSHLPRSRRNLSHAAKVENDDDAFDEDGLSLEAFQKAKENIVEKNEADEFSGYDFRDILYAKWGQCYDVDFNRVESFGFKKVYLNILPFYLGRRPFRHKTEYDYLCHLQAVVEILQEYNQLDYVLYQIGETNKRPIPGRSPLVAVPCRLDLTPEQVDKILGSS